MTRCKTAATYWIIFIFLLAPFASICSCWTHICRFFNCRARFAFWTMTTGKHLPFAYNVFPQRIWELKTSWKFLYFWRRVFHFVIVPYHLFLSSFFVFRYVFLPEQKSKFWNSKKHWRTQIFFKLVFDTRL